MLTVLFRAASAPRNVKAHLPLGPLFVGVEEAERLSHLELASLDNARTRLNAKLEDQTRRYARCDKGIVVIPIKVDNANLILDRVIVRFENEPLNLDIGVDGRADQEGALLVRFINLPLDGFWVWLHMGDYGRLYLTRNRNLREVQPRADLTPCLDLVVDEIFGSRLKRLTDEISDSWLEDLLGRRLNGSA